MLPSVLHCTLYVLSPPSPLVAFMSMWLRSGLRALLLHCHSGLRAKQQKNPARVAASKTQKRPVSFFGLAAAAEPKATHHQITGLSHAADQLVAARSAAANARGTKTQASVNKSTVKSFWSLGQQVLHDQFGSLIWGLQDAGWPSVSGLLEKNICTYLHHCRANCNSFLC